jgi:hypothetical protein
MSLFRTGIKPLVNINTIVCDNFVNLKTTIKIPHNRDILNFTASLKSSTFTKLIGTNKSELGDTINLIDLKKYKLNKSIKSIVEYNEDEYNHLHKKVLTKSSDKLKKEIYSHTYFEYGFENWIITDLVKKYNITGKELFLSMTENNEKYNNIWNNYPVANSGYKSFDWIECYGIKNSYPVDIYKSETRLNLRRYVDRSGIGGYERLIELMEEKIKSKPVEYLIVNEENDENEENEEIKRNEEIKVNDNYDKSETIEDKIFVPSMDLEGKKINYFNHNLDSNKIKYTFDLDTYTKLATSSNGVNVYEDRTNFLMKEDIEKLNEFKNFISDGIKKKIFNLNKYFTYELRPCYDWDSRSKTDKSDIENYILTPQKKCSMENISITNCLIFGETNIRFSDVEKLLSLIRFETQHYSVTLDNFTIYYYSEHCLGANLNDEKINSMEFCKYQNMLECAKWLVQIMNEINPNLINHHNYHTIVEYCKYKDHWQEQQFNNLILREKYRIKETTFEIE